MEARPDWASFEPIPDEAFTDDEIDSSNETKFEKLKAGRYLCTCIASEPREKKTKVYSTMAANLKFQVDQVYEIEGDAVDPEKWDHFVGSFIWDDIFLYHPDEKPGMKKRRILVASKLGILKDGKLSQKSWQEDVIGKRAIVTLVYNNWVDKITGEEKQNTRVDFNGYEEVQGGNDMKPSSDNFDDI